MSYRNRIFFLRAAWIFIGYEFALISLGNAFEIQKFNSEFKLTEPAKSEPSDTDEKKSGEYAVPNGFKLVHADKTYSDLSEFPRNRKRVKKENSEIITQEEQESSKVYFRRKFEELKRIIKITLEDMFYSLSAGKSKH